LADWHSLVSGATFFEFLPDLQYRKESSTGNTGGVWQTAELRTYQCLITDALGLAFQSQLTAAKSGACA